jgi:hemerythrin-like domain-containing protein
MNDPMTILKADHREAKQLLQRLAESEEGREREDMANQLATALTLHMDLEERLVYPLVREQIGEEDEEEAEVEHRLARDGLAKMLSMTEVPGFGAAVEMLLGGIEHHVKEEESELLPELKQAMERSEWLALGDSIAQAKADAGMPVKQSSPSRRSSKRKKASSRN